VDGLVGLPPLSDVAIAIHRSSENASHIAHVSEIILAMLGNRAPEMKSDREKMRLDVQKSNKPHGLSNSKANL
jgi:hypothetical protein